MMTKRFSIWLITGSTLLNCSVSVSTQAQIVPDNTLPENTVVTPQGDVIQIDGGTTRGGNLFHSFEQFSVGDVETAFFNNALDIQNILSRVTGGSISEINGLIQANGTANLFLINPAGIIFGQDAFLDVGGSFIATTADSLLFPNGIEYSATNPQASPILTINAPIGLRFRDDPQPIENFANFIDDNGTPDNFDDDDFIGLRVPADETLALIGGDIFIDGGFLTTEGGRIEIGSVDANSTVNITPIEKGFDFSYEDVTDFRDINLNFAAFVFSFGENTGDIQVTGRNISLIEGSQIGIDNEFSGQAANLEVIASETLELDGNAAEVDLGDDLTLIFNDVFDDATGEGSQISIEAPILTITNGAQIAAINDFGGGQGVDININASEILLENHFVFDVDDSIPAGIFAQAEIDAVGDGGNINITTERLTVNEGAQISTATFGSGDAGDLTVNADFIELIGEAILEEPIPSALGTDVGQDTNASGNGGDLTINTQRLIVRDGGEIGTVAQNEGNGGNLTINATESVLLSGTSPTATLQLGRGGIFVDVEPSLEDDSGEPIPTTGSGGTLELNTSEFIVERGAIISANTFSQGQGGNANINVDRLIVRSGGEIGAGSLIGTDTIDDARGAGGSLDISATESVEVFGSRIIDGEVVNSRLFTLAEERGDAGNLTLTTNNLIVRDGGNINASATGTGAAGELDVTAEEIALDGGSITATTAAGEGGNITLNIANDLTLRNNSLISAEAQGDADGGNININSNNFILAFPASENGNDIVANANRGQGGNINITAESLFGIEERSATQGNATNDIDASSEFGLDGSVSIRTPDTSSFEEVRQTPENIVETDTVTANICDRNPDTKRSSLVVKGKGGVPPEPTEPLTSRNIYINGDVATSPESEIGNLGISAAIKPIRTFNGDIYPARGVIVTEEGRVILTAYPTDNLAERILTTTANCDRR